MFGMITIVVVTLRQQRRIQTLALSERSLPSLAVSSDASPHGWSQIWSHLLANAANHSRISTSKALRGLPWAQGVADSSSALKSPEHGTQAPRCGLSERTLSTYSSESNLPAMELTL